MNIHSKTGLVGFLLALSALNLGVAEAKGNHSSSEKTLTVEERLSRLTNTLSSIENQLLTSDQENIIDQEGLLVNRGVWANGGGRAWVNTGRGGRGWADGRGRDWVNGRRTGWADGRGGSWVNGNNWRNGWGDGGGFWNSR